MIIKISFMLQGQMWTIPRGIQAYACQVLQNVGLRELVGAIETSNWKMQPWKVSGCRSNAEERWPV